MLDHQASYPDPSTLANSKVATTAPQKSPSGHALRCMETAVRAESHAIMRARVRRTRIARECSILQRAGAVNAEQQRQLHLLLYLEQRVIRQLTWLETRLERTIRRRNTLQVQLMEAQGAED